MRLGLALFRLLAATSIESFVTGRVIKGVLLVFWWFCPFFCAGLGRFVLGLWSFIVVCWNFEWIENVLRQLKTGGFGNMVSFTTGFCKHHLKLVCFKVALNYQPISSKPLFLFQAKVDRSRSGTLFQVSPCDAEKVGIQLLSASPNSEKSSASLQGGHEFVGLRHVLPLVMEVGEVVVSGGGK